METTTITSQRQPDAPIDARFADRRSHYAFDPTPLGDGTLASLLEAARWAPSSFNEQPWRFHIATRGPDRDRLDATLMAGNRAWSDDAPAIIWIVAKTTLSDHSYAGKMGLAGQANRHAWFDTGSATMQLLLEAQAHGLVTRPMGGLDPEAAHAALGLDDEHDVIAAIAVGRPGPIAALPDALRRRAEAPPSGRLPVADLLVGGDD
ncbi:MAG: nitroreductase family protein [Thermoplasmatota archaeon]